MFLIISSIFIKYYSKVLKYWTLVIYMFEAIRLRVAILTFVWSLSVAHTHTCTVRLHARCNSPVWGQHSESLSSLSDSFPLIILKEYPRCCLGFFSFPLETELYTKSDSEHLHVAGCDSHYRWKSTHLASEVNITIPVSVFLLRICQQP